MSGSFRRSLGSLLVLPAVILLLGSEWTWERPIAAELRLHEAGEPARPIRLHPRREGARPQRGLRLEPGDQIELRLPEPVSDLRISLQADAHRGLRVLGSGDADDLRELWRVPRAPVLAGLSTRESPTLRADPAVTVVRLEVADDAPHAVSAFRVQREPVGVVHVALIPLLWGAWTAAAAIRRFANGAPSAWAGAFLRAWERADPWIAAALVYAVVFQLSAPVLVSAGAAVAIAAAMLALRRAPGPGLVGAATAILVFGYALPRAATSLIEGRIAGLHDESVDHRLVPDGDEINSDGVRFRGEAGSIATDDYVVLFLGDSFTYGEKLRYEDTYPSQFERILKGAGCRERVAAVNFGWVSSSPLLSLRLLREIGRAYRPDLVVYSLDLTDFHDDLHYEVRLAEGGDLDLDPAEALGRLVRIHAPWLDLDGRVFADLRRMLRVGGEPAGPSDDPLDPSFVPRNRFFVANFPLRATRARIERGVMRNLAAIHAHARDALDARMALVIYPRAFQYSRDEALESWEEHQYERLGPFSREIFRYFDSVAEDLPYETVNLLPDFERADGARLFFERDPHWSPAGARLAAEGVARALAERGLVPCPPDPVSRASSGSGAPSPSGNPD